MQQVMGCGCLPTDFVLQSQRAATCTKSCSTMCIPSWRRPHKPPSHVLTRELHHRTRNLLGIVNSIARQMLKRSQSLEEFGARFAHRIDALSRVQALVARSETPEIYT
jgi:hypothetical protein